MKRILLFFIVLHLVPGVRSDNFESWSKSLISSKASRRVSEEYLERIEREKRCQREIKMKVFPYHCIALGKGETLKTVKDCGLYASMMVDLSSASRILGAIGPQHLCYSTFQERERDLKYQDLGLNGLNFE